jgi:hypothetical protein
MILTRRALVLAGVTSLAHSANAGPRKPVSSTNVRYIMPVPAGTRNGDSWANAASIWQLNDMIAAVGPGGTVYIRGDAGSYTFRDNRVSISKGGQAGSPVTAMGVDGTLAPMKVTVVGNRTAWTLPADPEVVTKVRGWSSGRDIFHLTTGADYLIFKNFDFQRTGQPFHLAGSMHKGITISDCNAYNFLRLFEHESGTSHVDTILRNITGTGFSKTAIRIRGNSHSVLLEDITLNSGRQDGDYFATGVECNDTAHDIVMRRVTVMNCHDTSGSDPNKFWNADGFASERGNYSIHREDCTSSGNTDAGYDDKGTDVTHVNCTAAENKVNYKFWGPSHTNIDCQALNPRSRGGTGPQIQYYVYGGGAPDSSGADVLIRDGVISDNDPYTSVFVAEAYNSVFRISGVAITHHAATVVQKELNGRGNVFLQEPGLDPMPPRITSSATAVAATNVNFAHLVKANKPVTWSIVGGRDAASFKVVPDRRASTITMTASAGGTSRHVIVRATDSNRKTAEQTITVSFGVAPDVFFKDDFDRADQDLGTSADWRLAAEDGAESRKGDIAIRDRKLAIFNTSHRGVAYASPDCGFADHYAQATVAQIPADHNGVLACRLTNADDFIGVEFKKGRISLYERAKGRFRELGFVTGAPVPGDVIRLEVKGANATVENNGVVIIGSKPTVGTNAKSTWCGLVARNIAVEPWIDNYEAGPL